MHALSVAIINFLLNGTAESCKSLSFNIVGKNLSVLKKNANHVLRFPQKSAGVVGKQQVRDGAHKSQHWLYDLKKRVELGLK